MEVMKQTAVEWLRDLYENRPAYEECILEDEWEEALKMEKEQIKDAYKQGTCHHGDGYTATEYYEETFKANEKCTASSPGSGQPPKS